MSQPKSKNLVWHAANVSHEERERLRGQKGCVVWLTGLSASGKSTIARRVEELLLQQGFAAYALDGDNFRTELNRDLGFSPEDRKENIRRVGCVAKLFADSATICLTAFISPYQDDRDTARATLPDGRFIEAYVATNLETCEARDPKGMYRKARAGTITSFTGVSAPYQPPENPELVLYTKGKTVDDTANEVIDYLRHHGFLGDK